MYPQLKDVEVKMSRRVLFDVQGHYPSPHPTHIFVISNFLNIGQVFGISVDILKQVPCVLASLAEDGKFKSKEPDGMSVLPLSSIVSTRFHPFLSFPFHLSPLFVFLVLHSASACWQTSSHLSLHSFLFMRHNPPSSLSHIVF